MKNFDWTIFTRRIALSNHRIKKVEDGKVTFTFKDYVAGGLQKLLTLQSHEFIRRFCMHILPKRFVKIRHYGFLAWRNKPDLKRHQHQIGVLVYESNTNKKHSAPDFASPFCYKCPFCKTGTMIRILSFDANAPPHLYTNTTKVKVETIKMT